MQTTERFVARVRRRIGGQGPRKATIVLLGTRPFRLLQVRHARSAAVRWPRGSASPGDGAVHGTAKMGAVNPQSWATREAAP
jgi:hypothetical protein